MDHNESLQVFMRPYGSVLVIMGLYACIRILMDCYGSI